MFCAVYLPSAIWHDIPLIFKTGQQWFSESIGRMKFAPSIFFSDFAPQIGLFFLPSHWSIFWLSAVFVQAIIPLSSNDSEMSTSISRIAPIIIIKIVNWSPAKTCTGATIRSCGFRISNFFNISFRTCWLRILWTSSSKRTAYDLSIMNTFNAFVLFWIIDIILLDIWK